MAKTKVSQESLEEILKAVPHLAQFLSRRMWIDYDKEADVLYISFRKPQDATDTQMLDNGILLRYKGNELVGITILEALSRN